MVIYLLHFTGQPLSELSGANCSYKTSAFRWLTLGTTLSR